MTMEHAVQRIKDARIAKGLTVAQAAASMGVSQSYWSQVECGKVANFQVLERMAAVVGLDIAITVKVKK